MDFMQMMQMLQGLGGGMGMGGMPMGQPPAPELQGTLPTAQVPDIPQGTPPGNPQGAAGVMAQVPQTLTGDVTRVGQAPPMEGPRPEALPPAQPQGFFQRMLGGLGGRDGGPKNGTGSINPAMLGMMLQGLGRSGPMPRPQQAPLPVASQPGHGGAMMMPGNFMPGRR